MWTQLRRLALPLAVLLAGTLAGCASASPSPVVRPAILAAWEALGATCGEPETGMPDNNPQWSCDATIRGVSVGMVLLADETGPLNVELQVPAGTDPADAKAIFESLVSTTDDFPGSDPQLPRWIEHWDGGTGEAAKALDNGHATIESDDTWIGLYLSREPR